MASDDLNKFIEAEYEQKASGEEDIVLRYDSNGFGTTVDKSFFEYVTSLASDTADVAVDVGKGAVRGTIKLAEGATGLGLSIAEKLGAVDEGTVNEFGKYFQEKVYPVIGETEGVAGALTEGVFQFLTPGLGYYNLANKFIKLKGVSGFFAKALSAEAATVATAQVPMEGNFVTLISSLTGLDNTKSESMAREIFNYIATPETEYTADTVLEEKFKAIIGDSPLGPFGEAVVPLFKYLGKIGREMKYGKQKAGMYYFIKDNPDGFSVTMDGKTPQDLGYSGGYMVAPIKATEIIKPQKKFNMQDVDLLLDKVEAMENILDGRYNEVYAGGWAEKGNFVLDVSVRVDNKDDALYIAKQGNQDGVFDLNEFKTIYTEPGIEELKQTGTYNPGKDIDQGTETREISRRFEETGLATGGAN
jgi:hypothetical protein